MKLQASCVWEASERAFFRLVRALSVWVAGNFATGFFGLRARVVGR